MTDWLTDYFWAIDPGESKCGVALFANGRCVQAIRSTPDECLDKLWRHLRGLDDEYAMPSRRPAALVVERFALRNDLAAMQTGSEMGTSQMIGAIRWMARYHGVGVEMQTPRQAHALEQQEPFKDWPQRRFASYGQGRDAKMAELHGLFRISTGLSSATRRQWHNSLLDY